MWPMRYVLLLLALAAAANSAAAQRRDSLPLPLGARVRVLVTERPPGKYSGSFAGADSLGVQVVERGTQDVDPIASFPPRS